MQRETDDETHRPDGKEGTKTKIYKKNILAFNTLRREQVIETAALLSINFQSGPLYVY